MRGKPAIGLDLAGKRWNIPAHAGKTLAKNSSMGRSEEHPRACGENNGGHFTQHIQVGTSPRMRGKHEDIGLGFIAVRNIPAHAGKTRAVGGVARVAAEHPRACGENIITQILSMLLHGTSPRMRGKRSGVIPGQGHRRNIPAHAGKTFASASWYSLRAEHPRACGENLDCDFSQPNKLGTSPRMRGKRQGYFGNEASSGNIPAHAGKTTSLLFVR